MTERDAFRHLLATLAYRTAKCLRDAPEAYVAFDTGGGKTPLTILAHIGDLLDWTLSMAQGPGVWKAATPGTWVEESARFHRGLQALDDHLASGAPVEADWLKLFQGPLADALTHAGQLALLRRMAGAPVPGESYFAAAVTTGRVGPDQPEPVKPFKRN